MTTTSKWWAQRNGFIKKNWIRSTLLRSVTCRIGTQKPIRHKNLNPRIRVKNLGSVPSENDKKSYRYRIHKSRIRHLDPRDLNARPDSRKIEVPIQNKVPGSRKFKVPIQKKWGTDTKGGTGFKKNQGTDTKWGTGFKKNQGTDTKWGTGFKKKNQGTDRKKRRYRYGTAKKMRYYTRQN